METVAFNDLRLHHEALRDEINAAIEQVIKESAFIRGPHVDEFERSFSELMGRKHTVSCSDGTNALYIAMHALGVQPGDEVIVPGMSWISTSETVTQAGGTVRFCDIDLDTYVMDPKALEAAITPRTVGVIPVHLYGHPAPMDAIMAIAEKHGLWVVEDCAQAHMAMINDRMVGSFGAAATFSFYPGKNLGAMGDAGAITTDDDELCRKMAMFARHGGLKKGDHEIEGINSRLDGLQAAILNVKLPHLTEWTRLRRAAAQAYLSRLPSREDVAPPTVAQNCDPVWHLFVVRAENRNELSRHLKGHGVQTVVNYPRALPFLPCYADRGHISDEFPNSYALQESCLSLPIFPEITDAQINRVVEALSEW